MKKLFILAPAILLTAMVHSAAENIATITVSAFIKIEGKDHASKVSKKLNVNLDTETFSDLAKKFNHLLALDYPQQARQVGLFTWTDYFHIPSGAAPALHSYSAEDTSTLKSAGIHDQDFILAELEKEESWLPEIKEPDVD